MTHVDFTKWHGLGNDYIIVSDADLGFTMTPAAARAICDRHFGVGSDGILLWTGTEAGGFRLEIWNPDGSTAEMCGNGMRMLARYLHDSGLAREDTFAVETSAGTIAPTVLPDGQVRVHMGKARMGEEAAGFDAGAAGPDGRAVLEAGGGSYQFTFVDMGNPHCVIEADDPEAVDLAVVGPAIEHHPAFSNRANVEFMKVIGPAEISMRVWERGAGETSACGTGACAVAVAARSAGKTDGQATVHLPGGDLLIEVDDGLDVYMTGPVEEVYKGTMSQEFVSKIKNMK
jgi:diaminopimelate epimerase